MMSDSTSRKIYFNAPAMMPADISVYPGRYATPPSETPTRQPVRTTLFNENSGVNKENRSSVITRKGWLTPDLTYEDDWVEQDVDPESEGQEDDTDGQSRGGGGFIRWGSNSPNNPNYRPPREENDDQQNELAQEANLSNLFPNNTQYGFRFMYNPPSLDFSIGVTPGVNQSFIFSGAEKAVQMIGTGSSITVNLTISRVDDLAAMSALSPGRFPTLDELRELLPLYGNWAQSRQSISNDGFIDGKGQRRSQAYMINVETSAKLTQLEEISKQGTMHDMNHLFRSFTGRNWKTAYRGITSDIGIAYSAPLVLYLSDKMTYRVILSNLSYSHRIFSPDMIPTLTDVSIQFTRVPDVVAWEGEGGPGTRLESRL